MLQSLDSWITGKYGEDNIPHIQCSCPRCGNKAYKMNSYSENCLCEDCNYLLEKYRYSDDEKKEKEFDNWKEYFV